MTYVLVVCRESVVDASRHNHQIALLQLDPDPVVVLASYIEVSAPIEDVPDLLILVQMLVEEVLHFLFVTGQSCGRDLNLISVLVVPFGGKLVYRFEVVGEFIVQDPKIVEVFG